MQTTKLSNVCKQCRIQPHTNAQRYYSSLLQYYSHSKIASKKDAEIDSFFSIQILDLLKKYRHLFCGNSSGRFSCPKNALKTPPFGLLERNSKLPHWTELFNSPLYFSYNHFFLASTAQYWILLHALHLKPSCEFVSAFSCNNHCKDLLQHQNETVFRSIHRF